MIIVNQLKLKPGFSESLLLRKTANALKVMLEDIIDIKIEKMSVDARRKPDIFIVLSVVVNVKHEDSVLRRLDNPDIKKYEPEKFSFEVTGTKTLINRPVIVGDGPCGLFAAYFLAQNGYKPIILERGFDVESRTEAVENFFNGGKLCENSNVLFGEGGAGTFSDGKLNTLVKDKGGRNKEVLRTFVKFGADESILYDAKPHIGTDVLKKIVKAMREAIEANGGEFKFNAEVTDLRISQGKIIGVVVNGLINIDTENVILAIGHSARNTFNMLYEKGISLEQKDFAVGLRVEHKQKMINDALLSSDPDVMRLLPPASYKLTYKAKNGRGVYSFCMCPGGYVVNASSEDGYLCVNGMSYSGRDGENANSAIVVTVNKEDFESDYPLAGIDFQRSLERKAYLLANGCIPVEHYGDFKAEVLEDINLNDVDLADYLKITPQTKGIYSFCRVSEILPKEIAKTLIEGMEYFNKIIPGFASEHVIVSGVESRTSSPVRILRNDDFESVSCIGLYPCGEGAGYAGGITSAAMDGIKVAQKLASNYKPFS